MSTATGQIPKQEAHRLIDKTPGSVSWQELADRRALRADIEQALADIQAGRVTDVGDVRREFGLPE